MTKFLNTYRQKVIAGAIAVAVIMAAVTFLAFLNFKKAPGDSLAPKDTINVVDVAYKEPCRLLPESSVSDIFGELSPTSYLNENYIDRTVSPEDIKKLPSQTIDSTCTYVFNDKQNSTVSLAIDYYPTTAAAADSWKSSIDLGDGTYEKQLADFEASLNQAEASGKSNESFSKASRDLIAFMKETLPRAKREGATSVDGLNKSILFNKDRGTFISLYKNSLITMKYEFGSENVFDKDRQISPTELTSVLGRVQKSFDVINQNLDDKDITQAPSPTLRNGTKSQVGKTKILEPCEILDSKTFETIFKKPSNDPVVEREAAEKDISLERTHVDGYPILTKNSCLRRYTKTFDTLNSASIRDGYVGLDLYYAKDDSTARKYLEGLIKSFDDPAITKVSTNADLSYYRNSSHGSLKIQSLRFLKEGYVGTISIAKDDQDAMSIEIPKQDFINAANIILKRLP